MTRICISNLTIIALDNGLSPGGCQAIIWTNAGISLYGPLGTNFNEILIESHTFSLKHDDVLKWIHFPHYWPFVRGIHWSPVNSPHKGRWRGASMFSLIFAWINVWVNNCEAGDLRRHHAHYDFIVMENLFEKDVWKNGCHFVSVSIC